MLRTSGAHNNPPLLIDEIETLLKQGGVCVWTTPVRGPVQTLYDKTRGEKLHVSLFKPKEAEKLIQIFPILVHDAHLPYL